MIESRANNSVFVSRSSFAPIKVITPCENRPEGMPNRAKQGQGSVKHLLWRKSGKTLAMSKLISKSWWKAFKFSPRVWARTSRTWKLWHPKTSLFWPYTTFRIWTAKDTPNALQESCSPEDQWDIWYYERPTSQCVPTAFTSRTPQLSSSKFDYKRPCRPA